MTRMADPAAQIAMRGFGAVLGEKEGATTFDTDPDALIVAVMPVVGVHVTPLAPKAVNMTATYCAD